MAKDISVITIEEIDGQKRAVELHGSALPNREAEWKSELNAPTTWYPGNGDEATQHVLGPKDLPSNWQGEWSSTMMNRDSSIVRKSGGNESQVVSPQILVEACEALFRGGVRLRVTWTTAMGNRGITIIREGRCTEWSFKYKTIYDVSWEFTFSWMGRGGIQRPRVTSTRSDMQSATRVSLETELNSALGELRSTALARARSGTPGSGGFLTVGKIKSLFDYPEKLISGFERSVTQFTSQLSEYGDLFKNLGDKDERASNAMRGFLANINREIKKFSAKASVLSPEQIARGEGVAEGVSGTVELATSIEVARKLARKVVELQRALQKDTSNNPGGPLMASNRPNGLGSSGLLDVYVTKEGDTPMLLSTRYYGVPDYASAIMSANHIPWSTVVFAKNKTLIIPILNKGR